MNPALLDFANKLLSLGVILSQIFVVVMIAYYLFFRKSYPAIQTFLGKYGLSLAFFSALVAMIGSLFYSQYVGFAPCDLCWFQRIFMYPLVIILGIAWLRKDTTVVWYAIPLAVIGWVISLYQNYISVSGSASFCQASLVSCTKIYVLEFSYVTIPMMAITAFSLVLVFLIAVALRKHLL